MRLTTAVLPFAGVLLLGCAGATTTGSTSSVDLNLSNPTIAYNVNLARMYTATDFARTTTSPLLCTATQTPGPSGVTTRVARINIATPVVGTEYALTSGGTTYVEWSETTSTGNRVWRSQGGKLTLTKSDEKGSSFSLTDVEMTAYSGVASGGFRLNGSLAIRF